LFGGGAGSYRGRRRVANSPILPNAYASCIHLARVAALISLPMISRDDDIDWSNRGDYFFKLFSHWLMDNWGQIKDTPLN